MTTVPLLVAAVVLLGGVVRTEAAERAFYYARVLEIPTPRWTAYDAKRFGVRMPKDAPMVSQERAYTSPIWYAPG